MGPKGFVGYSRRPTRRLPWVGPDVRFSTLVLPSRFAQTLTRAQPQQQQQQQRVAFELEEFSVIREKIFIPLLVARGIRRIHLAPAWKQFAPFAVTSRYGCGRMLSSGPSLR